MMGVRQQELFTLPRKPRKAPAPEFAIHCMVADALDKFLRRDWIYTHIANGELREKRTAARLKRMGVKPGWPDFILLPPSGQAHFLELKRRGGALSAAQTDFALWAFDHEIPFACADSFDAALAQLKDWGALRVSVSA
jgi:hypothetical protein